LRLEWESKELPCCYTKLAISVCFTKNDVRFLEQFKSSI
jgi:hypothetical protein